MNEPRWLKRIWLDAIHFQQLQRFGGLYGIRDANAIDAALARPQHRWTYEPGVDLADLAAASGYGLIRNHGYPDGNKRMGFVVLAVFLDLNGWELIAPEPEVVVAIVAEFHYSRIRGAIRGRPEPPDVQGIGSSPHRRPAWHQCIPRIDRPRRASRWANAQHRAA
jgi:death-on-curing protein